MLVPRSQKDQIVEVNVRGQMAEVHARTFQVTHRDIRGKLRQREFVLIFHEPSGLFYWDLKDVVTGRNGNGISAFLSRVFVYVGENEIISLRFNGGALLVRQSIARYTSLEKAQQNLLLQLNRTQKDFRSGTLELLKKDLKVVDLWKSVRRGFFFKAEDIRKLGAVFPGVLPPLKARVEAIKLKGERWNIVLVNDDGERVTVILNETFDEVTVHGAELMHHATEYGEWLFKD